MKGEVAMAYGELIEKLWSGSSSSFAPRDFKVNIEGMDDVIDLFVII
jgi:hypothetical protein